MYPLPLPRFTVSVENNGFALFVEQAPRQCTAILTICPLGTCCTSGAIEQVMSSLPSQMRLCHLIDLFITSSAAQLGCSNSILSHHRLFVLPQAHYSSFQSHRGPFAAIRVVTRLPPAATLCDPYGIPKGCYLTSSSGVGDSAASVSCFVAGLALSRCLF